MKHFVAVFFSSDNQTDFRIPNGLYFDAFTASLFLINFKMYWSGSSGSSNQFAKLNRPRPTK